MHVVVASDGIGALSSLRAGQVLASGWDGATTSVLSVGEAGAGFVSAFADHHGLVLSSGVVDGALVEYGRASGLAVLGVRAPEAGPGIAYDRSSWPLGSAVRSLLEDAAPPLRLVLDLTGAYAHDGGAGLLAALGAAADRPLDHGVAGLQGIGRIELAPARARLTGVDLVGVVPDDEVGAALLGLRGITSRRRDAETDPAVLLQTDTTLEQLAVLLGPGLGQRPGAGACGGLALAILALGGRLLTGPELAWSTLPAEPVDLVVTGCTVFDFARRGGGVVAAAAEHAAARLSPCVLLAGAALVGSREMRALGVEAAYAVHEAHGDRPIVDVSEVELASLAGRVARSWRW